MNQSSTVYLHLRNVCSSYINGAKCGIGLLEADAAILVYPYCTPLAGYTPPAHRLQQLPPHGCCRECVWGLLACLFAELPFCRLARACHRARYLGL